MSAHKIVQNFMLVINNYSGVNYSLQVFLDYESLSVTYLPELLLHSHHDPLVSKVMIKRWGLIIVM